MTPIALNTFEETVTWTFAQDVEKFHRELLALDEVLE